MILDAMDDRLQGDRRLDDRLQGDRHLETDFKVTGTLTLGRSNVKAAKFIVRSLCLHPYGRKVRNS